MTTSAESEDLGSVHYPLSHHDLHLWALQVYIMLSAGISLTSSLETIIKSGMPRLSQVCELLTQKIRSGASLSQAMVSMRPVFSPLAINLVSIGEQTGQLVLVLQRLSSRAFRQDKMQRNLISSLAYPVFLCTVSLGMALFMAFYMFPKLVPFLMGLGVTLPWPTRILIWSVENLSSSALIVTILTVGLVRLLSTSEESRMQQLRDRLLFETPVIGDLNRNRVYEDCFSDLHLLLEAGCDLVLSLKVIHSSWPGFNRRKDKCLEKLRTGSSFVEAVEASELFPRAFLLQIASADETGQLPRAFESLSEQLDEMVSMKVEQLTQILEPLLFSVMGVVTGFVVLATFLPLYGVVETAL